MKIKIFSHNSLKKLLFFTLIPLFLYSCNGKFPGADARKFPANPEERVKKNLEEGRGFTLNNDLFESGKGGVFEFASANELWRASLDVIDFMPLVTVDYSGGMIITDWYTDSNTTDDSLKFTIRFLSNEIRSDSLKIIIHKKTCKTGNNCIVTKTSSNRLEDTIRSEIIKKAASLEAQSKKKKKKS